MNWYSASITFESRVNGAVEVCPLWEWTVYLVRADSDKAAYAKATVAGKQSEHSYKNGDGEIISWHFLRVVEVQDLCLDSIEDGTEVFSKLSETMPFRLS